MMQSLRDFSSYLAGVRTGKPGAVAAARPGAFWLAALSAATAWLIPIFWLHAHNSRLLPSWHGFLHAAIATRFPGDAVPPENPFFAGERLPYYWFYQWLAAMTARLIGADPLHIFQWITLASLVALIVFAGLIGRSRFRTIGAGLLIGYLALAGLNPLGPAIAAAKHFIAARPLASAPSGPVETVFVSNQTADDLMTTPLLPALYVSSDWRHGQNLVWFLDISSRAPALSLIMVLLFMLLNWRPTFIRGIVVSLVAALMTALNPLIGLAVSGSLAAGFLALTLLEKYGHYRVLAGASMPEDPVATAPGTVPERVAPGTVPERVAPGTVSEGRPLMSAICLCVALMAGPALAAPTYYHLFANEGTASLTSMGYAGVKSAALAANFLLLVPLAVFGLWRASQQVALWLGAVTAAGLLLLLAVPVIHLEQGNEHNLVNAAQCLLAAPAVAWLPTLTPRGKWGRVLPTLLFAVFLPTTVCALLAFAGRPGLPLDFRGQALHRAPEQDPLNQFYLWARSQTPADAVFISDPRQPVKMSGNVAEFPAFTARALFTDHATYMTRPHRDAALRAEIATALASGQPLTPSQSSYVHRLRRPLYVVTYQANDQAQFTRLTKRHGAPVFHQGFVAAFKFALPAVTAPELTLSFSGFIGGSQFDSVRDVAVDSQGNMYLTGGTSSPDFPVTPGAYQTTHNPGTPDAPGISLFDVFVVKLDSTGKILWSTFLGGPNYDRAYAIEVDREGYVYVAGRAGRGFPVTPGAFQTSFMGGQEAAFYGPQDGFIAKLSPDGSRLVWASYFGTADPSIVRDLAVNQQGEVYIASGHTSGAYPTSVEGAFNNAAAGDKDAVVAKLKADGSAVLWASYLGGSSWESNENSVRLDAAGNPYVLLTTESTDIPTTVDVYDRTYGGDQDFYVARLTPDKGNLVWGSFLGGPRNESTETHEFAVDAAGNVYVAGPTKSPDFPTTEGAFQRTFSGGDNEIIVAKLSADGKQLLASTFIGGAGNDRPEGMAVDDAGNVYFTGTTTSSNFPVTPDAFQLALHGTRDAVVVELAADFSHLRYASYLGGSGFEYGRAARVDKQGNFYLGGETDSNDWPVRDATLRPPLPARPTGEVRSIDQFDSNTRQTTQNGNAQTMFAKFIPRARRQERAIEPAAHPSQYRKW